MAVESWFKLSGLKAEVQHYLAVYVLSLLWKPLPNAFLISKLNLIWNQQGLIEVHLIYSLNLSYVLDTLLETG